MDALGLAKKDPSNVVRAEFHKVRDTTGALTCLLRNGADCGVSVLIMPQRQYEHTLCGVLCYN